MQAFFDFYSPAYQHRFEPEEILSWYKQEGFPTPEVAYREAEGFAVRGDIGEQNTSQLAAIGARR